jgi:hypothetical protein
MAYQDNCVQNSGGGFRKCWSGRKPAVPLIRPDGAVP